MADAGGHWALILHGGAHTIGSADQEPHRQGCLAALDIGARLLSRGAAALDVTEAVVRALESDPTFNAGRGAVANSQGEIELDAAIMEGEGLAIGAVGAMRGFAHPVSIARRVMAARANLLVGQGAEAFAREHRAEPAEPSPASPSGGGDTVGCVCLDLAGHMAAALSTGGLEGKAPGRIGDAPLPGCGFYVDDTIGGVALSGDGEHICRVLVAARVMQALPSLGPAAAARAGLAAMARVGGEAGAIVLDRAGRFGYAHTSRHFAVALASDRLAPRAALEASELAGVDL